MEMANSTPEKYLHSKFVKLGSDRRRLTNELLALLPEIYERGIFKKYAETIIEYAGKFGGLSKGVVLKRLRLEKHLQDKPLLKESIRTEGVHKVALVAALATPETEKAWLSKIENMSKSALQELSKEVRSKREMTEVRGKILAVSGPGAGLGDSLGAAASCKAVPVKITLELDEEMTFLFLNLKKKIGNNLGNREVMKKILEMAGAAGGQKTCANPGEKRKINNSLRLGLPKKVIPGDNFTRYIPVHIKRASLANTNNHCSYPRCNRPPEIFHHTGRFVLNQNHKSITPLCKIHHEFAHNGLILNENQHSQNWRMQLLDEPDGPEQTDQIDHLYRWRRRLAIGKNKPDEQTWGSRVISGLSKNDVKQDD